jgi:hypothetical protein
LAGAFPFSSVAAEIKEMEEVKEINQLLRLL